LIAGFALAQLTGLRWLGGIVVVAGGGWCAVRLWRTVRPIRTLVVAVVYVLAFVVSHPLGRVVGSGVSVLLVAATAGAVTYAVMGPTGRSVSTTAPPTSSTR
jgi:hypothetical protein